MILDCKGISTDKYFIPPFELNEGEIVVIYLYSGAHFFGVEKEVADLLIGKVADENVVLLEPIVFAERNLTVAGPKGWFRPSTVGGYIDKMAGKDKAIAERIYEDERISKTTKLRSLDPGMNRLLSIYCAFSHGGNIAFDLRGVWALLAEGVYEKVKEQVKRNGSAILLDDTDFLRDDCTKFIRLEWTQKSLDEFERLRQQAKEKRSGR